VPRPDRQVEIRHTSWTEIDDYTDSLGFREGFVRVFLEFRGMILDDEPLDAKGAPAVVNQSNFARHFGIAGATFSRWLGLFGGKEFEHLSPGGTEAAKARQKEKAKKKDRDAAAQDVRRMVACTAAGFADKLSVRKLDDDMFWLDTQILVDWDAPRDKKRKVVEAWVEHLDKEVAAAAEARDKALELLSSLDEENAA